MPGVVGLLPGQDERRPGRGHLDRQYLLGDDLLVAPVFTDDGTVEYYVPEGTWTNVLTGQQVVGPRWAKDFHTLPLLARPDSVIPLAADDRRPVSAWADGVELRVHAFADGAERTVTVTVPRIEGLGDAARFHLCRTGAAHRHHRQPAPVARAHRKPRRPPAQPAGTPGGPLPYPA
ncbi:hypothetical protein [Kitasatospora sp. NPDC085879]|uniref:hypothetical protein n=1 Tax=Kitasatospora sp. NPDC085879 TaxID=3154769 RepID=UPI0034164A81